ASQVSGDSRLRPEDAALLLLVHAVLAAHDPPDDAAEDGDRDEGEQRLAEEEDERGHDERNHADQDADQRQQQAEDDLHDRPGLAPASLLRPLLWRLVSV